MATTESSAQSARCGARAARGIGQRMRLTNHLRLILRWREGEGRPRRGRYVNLLMSEVRGEIENTQVPGRCPAGSSVGGTTPDGAPQRRRAGLGWDGDPNPGPFVSGLRGCRRRWRAYRSNPQRCSPLIWSLALNPFLVQELSPVTLNRCRTTTPQPDKVLAGGMRVREIDRWKSKSPWPLLGGSGRHRLRRGGTSGECSALSMRRNWRATAGAHLCVHSRLCRGSGQPRLLQV